MAAQKEQKQGYRPVVVLSLLSLLICGFLFPFVVTGISQVALPSQANGSLAQLAGRNVGSYYIDNGFTLPVFFHARNESNPLVASASGVDPDITLQDALSQVIGIHNATGIPTSDLIVMVKSHQQETLWVLGDPYVNVLVLNLALINSYPSVYSSYR
ncbi:MAG: potassium-transporting ATPase subunit C [Thaumarchaeota archaeon]|nr:potassium-transporting ATPase subunit C [Nitrososphaerota archaeon]